MYAVVKTGGKQYRVASGDTIKVEKIEGKLGDTVELNEVLLLADEQGLMLGHPFINGAMIKAEILDQEKDRKVIIYKYKRRKRYHRKGGHRQILTTLRVKEIQTPAQQAGAVAATN